MSGGEVFADRNINFIAMKNRLARLWRPGKGMCIKDLEQNLFVFQFYHEIDLRRVVEGGPWTFDSHILLVH